MKLGDAFGSVSPLGGMITGQGFFGSSGFKNLLGSLSPMFGGMAGRGLFGSMFNPGQRDELAGPGGFADQPGIKGPNDHNPTGMNGMGNDYLSQLLSSLMQRR